ncbi:peroxiredoxin [Polymorphum gilvum]|uniref:Glutathione-dependent peroxiredoxin n=1 Tax=Polymorphum gilvum (strain LMG 25793 / CGMCC 1.9160 / SL003B-26A1) TaxID=991905 RepID=F2IZ90_POLGS|nr:peroxiredoxin [Polymorphum gilvum]ADZ71813.1 Peroxiredoxin-like protein [Polymorphum gilvum SL003B-26A1]
MSIKVGDRLPDGVFKTITADGPVELKSGDLFAGKTVVLFGVPGAFTPTCHMNHLPGFLEHHDTFKAKGVDTIAVVSVNDMFVMDAWKKATNAGDKILFLADGSADFVKAMGLDLDASGFGMGVRSKRFAMLVKDGTVVALNIEDVPGQATVSGAAALLEAL